MERLFIKDKNSMNSNLVRYILKKLAISDIFNIILVNRRMMDLLKESKLIETLKRIYKNFKGVSYKDMLVNNSNLIETCLANELLLCQKMGQFQNFDIEDWKELKEIVIYILTLKLVKEEKIELLSELHRKTLFYLRESFNLDNTSPKGLIINSTNIGKYPSKIISSVIVQNKLTILDLTKCIFTKFGFKNFLNSFQSHSFSSNNPLKKLILKRCQLGDKRIKEIFNVIKKKTNLYYLDLTNNNIKEDSIQVLANFPFEFFVKNLKLDFNDLTPKGTKYLAIYLQNNRIINNLSLVDAMTNEKSFNYISHALKSKVVFHTNTINFGLQKLTLGLNTLHDQTVVYFVNSLRINRTIKHIKIFFGEFTDRGLEIFCSYLADKMCTLEKLNLCSVCLNDKFEIFSMLINSLIYNNSIKFLSFTQCELEGYHLNLLLKLLKTNSNLECLDLRENKFTCEEKEILKKYVKLQNKLNINNDFKLII
jgi:hypothetical protein